MIKNFQCQIISKLINISTAWGRPRLLLPSAPARGGARREAADGGIRGVELRRREPRRGPPRQAQGHRVPKVMVTWDLSPLSYYYIWYAMSPMARML